MTREFAFDRLMERMNRAGWCKGSDINLDAQSHWVANPQYSDKGKVAMRQLRDTLIQLEIGGELLDPGELKALSDLASLLPNENR